MQDGAFRAPMAAREGIQPSPGEHRCRHGTDNDAVPLSRISWWVTVVVCLVAALLLLLNGYQGYSGVLLAVGSAAAVNLL